MDGTRSTIDLNLYLNNHDSTRRTIDLNLYLNNGYSSDGNYNNEVPPEGTPIAALDCRGSFMSLLLQPSPLHNTLDTRLNLHNVNPNSLSSAFGLNENDQQVASRRLDYMHGPIGNANSIRPEPVTMMQDLVPYSSSQLAPFDCVDYGYLPIFHHSAPASGFEQRVSSPPAVEEFMFGGRTVPATPVELIPVIPPIADPMLLGPGIGLASFEDYVTVPSYEVDNNAQEEDIADDDMFAELEDWSYEGMAVIQEQIGYVSTGLKEDEIVGVLRTKKLELHSLEAHDPCCICQEEEYKKDQELGILKCNHEFHLKCINKWLLRKNSCPLCRETVTTMTL